MKRISKALPFWTFSYSSFFRIQIIFFEEDLTKDSTNLPLDRLCQGRDSLVGYRILWNSKKEVRFYISLTDKYVFGPAYQWYGSVYLR